MPIKCSFPIHLKMATKMHCNAKGPDKVILTFFKALVDRSVDY